MNISRFLNPVDPSEKINTISHKRKHEETNEVEKLPKIEPKQAISPFDYFKSIKPKVLEEEKKEIAIKAEEKEVNDSESSSESEEALIMKLYSDRNYKLEKEKIKTPQREEIYKENFVDESLRFVENDKDKEIEVSKEKLEDNSPKVVKKQQQIRQFNFGPAKPASDETNSSTPALSIISPIKPLKSLPKKTQKGELLSDKYSPKCLKDLIGNKPQIQKLLEWFKKWQSPISERKQNDKYSARAILISGPPGIGKTTAARIITKDLGYQPVEFNASDTRNKQIIIDKAKPFCLNTSIRGPHSVGKGVLIMDEVDGMTTGDEGGNAALIELIKLTKIPIICICNDRHSTKIKSLANYCLDLKFYNPNKDEIANKIKEIAEKEELEINYFQAKEIAQISNGDMRQALNLLELVKKGSDLRNSGKDKAVCLSNFEAAKELFNQKKNKFESKIDLVLIDYDFIPMLVQENYIDVTEKLSDISESADSIALSDIIMSQIKGQQNWSLLHNFATTSSIIPTSFTNQYIDVLRFPELRSKGSSLNKSNRIFIETKQSLMHTSLGVCNEGIENYANCLYSWVIQLLNEEKIDEAVEVLLNYRINTDMLKEHLPHFSTLEMKEAYSKISKSVKTKLSKRIFTSQKTVKTSEEAEDEETEASVMVELI
ncbi:unnamed protein product [Blepharisma stoltei]|uniref:AAA+ ATPase domain-containing protein n=1 Tax=Blepharisma stoltei TaxID=1481888 RepID=A0AAU9IXP9_9CILI|nr:unnamed protein product [Blepharisma stoltei]